MTFDFEGSKPAGDVLTFFESLRINAQLRWDIFVSSEYLTLSYLVNDQNDARYEEMIDSALRSETTELDAVSDKEHHPTVNVKGRPDITDVKSLVEAFSQENSQFSGQSSKSVLARIVFGYGWVAERTFFTTLPQIFTMLIHFWPRYGMHFAKVAVV